MTATITTDQDRKITPTDFELWQTVLWSSIDSDGNPLDEEHSIHDVERADVARLNDEFWLWRDLADQVMIDSGRGDACLEDLWPTRVEHLYVLCRDGHGCDFTDDWITDSRSWKIGKKIGELARSMGPIGADCETTGRTVFCNWC